MDDESSLYRDSTTDGPLSTPKLAAAGPVSIKPVAAKRAPPPPPDDRRSVYVTRPSGTSFAWEIRRFGAIIVQQGTQTYATADEARKAGQDAIEAQQRA